MPIGARTCGIRPQTQTSPGGIAAVARVEARVGVDVLLFVLVHRKGRRRYGVCARGGGGGVVVVIG